MKNKFKFLSASLTVIALVLGSVGVSGLVSQAAESNSAHAGNPYRVIVTFEDPVNESAREALENKGGKILKELPLVDGAVVLLPDEAMVPGVGTLAGVKRVEPDARVLALHHREGHNGGPGGGSDPTPEPTPDPQSLEWGVDRIDAELAWGTSRGAAVKVAVVDTGIDQDHADLVGNLKGGVNFVSKGPRKPADPNNWNDDNGHGTHVAGIIAASDNTFGVVGVAPEAYLYAVKVLDRNGSGYTSDVIEGITWAMNNDIDVVNMSLGTTSDIQALHDAVDAAYAAGVVLVAAAGNSGDGDGTTNEISYPAKYSSVIAVAATASDDSTPYWSSEGAEVELAAPGVSIRSTWNDGSYYTISGTSMASPHVAGTVVLILGTAIPVAYDTDSDGVWDPVEVRANLIATADDVNGDGFDNFYGYGLVDAEESITGNQTNP